MCDSNIHVPEKRRKTSPLAGKKGVAAVLTDPPKKKKVDVKKSSPKQKAIDVKESTSTVSSVSKEVREDVFEALVPYTQDQVKGRTKRRELYEELVKEINLALPEGSKIRLPKDWNIARAKFLITHALSPVLNVREILARLPYLAK